MAIQENMNYDKMDFIFDAERIVEESFKIVSRYVKGNSPEDIVLKRCIISTGDPSIKDLIIFKNNPVNAGIEALRSCSNIIVDVKMVEAGINKEKVKNKIFVAIEHEYRDERSHKYMKRFTKFEGHKLTRVASGLLNLIDKMENAIIAIGNSPSAAIITYEIVKQGVRPALIIATPVGFVNASESKEMIRKLDIPSITTLGSRGGSTLCVTILNTLINLYYDRSD